MNKNSLLNPLLDEDINEISDPITKGICLFVLKEAREAFNRGEPDPSGFVSNRLSSSIIRLVREVD